MPNGSLGQLRGDNTPPSRDWAGGVSGIGAQMTGETPRAAGGLRVSIVRQRQLRFMAVGVKGRVFSYLELVCTYLEVMLFFITILPTSDSMIASMQTRYLG